MKDITDADYMHTKRVCKAFEIRSLDEHRDLYLILYSLLLADIFHNFRKMCLKIYHLYLVKFASAPGLAWQAALKKTEVKLELLTDIDMLLMVQKGIRVEICHEFYRYLKANSIYMKSNDKNKESSYLKYWDVNILHVSAMLQKFPLNNFEWIEDTSHFIKDYVKNYNDESDEGFFLEVDLGKLHELHNDLPFLLKKMKIEKVEKLVSNFHVKTEYVIHIRNLNEALNHGLILRKLINKINLIKMLG